MARLAVRVSVPIHSPRCCCSTCDPAYAAYARVVLGEEEKPQIIGRFTTVGTVSTDDELKRLVIGFERRAAQEMGIALKAVATKA
jgi:hypothetical protein